MENCIFCKIIKGEIPSWKVYEDENTYAFFDINPMSEYHTLVIPKKHYVNMFDIPEHEAVNIMRTIKKVITIYKEAIGLENVQVVNNNGEHAQQDVFHLHYHIVPRLKSDGQNIIWPKPKESVKEKFDELLAIIKTN